MMDFARTGRVLRIQQVNPTLRNVAVRFDEPLPVGKVFFDTIGLYHTGPENQALSVDKNAVVDEGRSMEFIIQQRIEELERELAQLKQFQLRNVQSDQT
jgi:hypothetical protein